MTNIFSSGVNMSNKMNLYVCSHTLNFARKFRCRAYTDNYLFYEFLNQFAYISVAIIKTSINCYRVIHYSSFMSVSRKSEYKSFSSISDMCVYLDSICPSAVENI